MWNEGCLLYVGGLSLSLSLLLLLLLLLSLMLVLLLRISPSHPFPLRRLDWQLQQREVRLQQGLVRGLVSALLQLPL